MRYVKWFCFTAAKVRLFFLTSKQLGKKMLHAPQQNSTMSWAVKMRRNMLKG